ncbi:MAG: glycosyltransferase family 4 protein [Candidatus Eisenbacteria bacterium]|uniref:Glycosyltransferase family 4 protein n=1 Tax=Eiseniibacteriota bacterium TaxID=2212470 RepID=A0A849SWZ1_UNCEI|nr:glycosyltransferase family 4 protein [Candidatus Eisenbacteria bacterium]
MRLALLCLDDSIPFGGTRNGSIRLRSEAEAWLRAGHHVTAIVSNPGPPQPVDDLRVLGLEVRRLLPAADTEDIEGLLVSSRVTHVCERLSPRSGHGALAASRLGLTHFYEVHSQIKSDSRPTNGKSDADLARVLLRAAFECSHGAIAVSHELAVWTRSVAPTGYPVAVVPGGVPRRFFDAPDPKLYRSLIPAWLRGGASLRVGFVGSLSPSHDLSALVHAAALVSRRRPVQVVIVGDGPQRNQLLIAADRRGVPVHLVGDVPHSHVHVHLAAMDVMVAPFASRELDRVPLALGEAMAAARPVVASAVRPVLELLDHEQTGLLVEPGDVHGLAASVERLAADATLAARLGVAARLRVRNRTWDQAAAEMVEALLSWPALPAPI